MTVTHKDTDDSTVKKLYVNEIMCGELYREVYGDYVFVPDISGLYYNSITLWLISEYMKKINKTP